MIEYVVPQWCQMPDEEHQCLNGCWGISYGLVQAQGAGYCLTCEYYNGNWFNWLERSSVGGKGHGTKTD